MNVSHDTSLIKVRILLRKSRPLIAAVQCNSSSRKPPILSINTGILQKTFLWQIGSAKLSLRNILRIAGNTLNNKTSFAVLMVYKITNKELIKTIKQILRQINHIITKSGYMFRPYRVITRPSLGTISSKTCVKIRRFLMKWFIMKAWWWPCRVETCSHSSW